MTYWINKNTGKYGLTPSSATSCDLQALYSTDFDGLE